MPGCRRRGGIPEASVYQFPCRWFSKPRPGERRFELWGYLVIERGSQVLLYTGSPIFKKSVVQGTFEEVCARIQSYLDFCNE